MHVIDVHEKQIYRQLDFVHDVMTKYVCMCACFSLGQGKSLHGMIGQNGVMMCPSTTKYAENKE